MLFLILLFLFIFFLFFFIGKNLNYSNIFLNLFSITWGAVFIIFILFNHEGVEYVTLKGILIIFTHIFMVFLGVYSSFFNPQKNRIKYHIHIPKIKIRIKLLFYILFILSLIGLILLSTQVGLFDALRNEELAKMRGDALAKDIKISTLSVFLTNFIYPLVIITPLYALSYARKPYILIIVFFMSVYYSLSTGGKGGVVILLLILFGSIYFLKKNKLLNISTNLLKILGIFFSLFVVGFIAFITSTRAGYYSGSIINDTWDMFISYFSNPIPAFCQILEKKEWLLLNFNLSDHSLIRTFSSLFGKKLEWQMDNNVVYIPNFFNVFSSFADSIFSFGLLLSFFYYFLVGKIFFWLDRKRDKNINKIFIYSIFILFAFYSFYVDIFYFMSGAWYCIIAFLFLDIKIDSPQKTF